MKRTNWLLCVIYAVLPLLAFPGSADEVVLHIGSYAYTISNKGHQINVVSVYNSATNTELIAKGTKAPLFEFVINGIKVTSEQPVWKYIGSESKDLLNGGKQLTLSYEGLGRLKGLELAIDRQYFANSSIIRERLRLHSDPKKSFRLTNLQGRNHFIFPQYDLSKDHETATPDITEIRMATFGQELLADYDPNATYDRRASRNLSNCHMFHTAFIKHPGTTDTSFLLKGPFTILSTGSYKIVTSYEHASQDQAKVANPGSFSGNDSLVDASQGVHANWEHVPTDSDYWFIGSNVTIGKDRYILSQRLLRGGYLNNEVIPGEGYYETVWSTINFLPPKADHLAAIKAYLLHQITEHPLSRKANYYYNTWGMQRDEPAEGNAMREVFNEKRVMEEINYAAQLNADLFVLDDGWQQTMGIWSPHTFRLPSGLTPLIQKIKSHHMQPGVWLSLMGIDSTTNKYKAHPGWVIRDSKGKPIAAQWNHPAFDIVGGFYQSIKKDLIRLVDSGIYYFKWDAINTFNSDLANLGHGDDQYSKKERIDRYNYLLPIYVVRLMRELREYNPNVVVEIDLTEPERAMVGLIALQEGKLFWMNNGASGYGDYSTFRSKSMRTIINQTGDLLPPEILTYAEYPHNVNPFYAQRYNVNSTLIAGHGLWGNLKKMSLKDRLFAGDLIAKSKRVMPFINGMPLTKVGHVGQTPEIYQQINASEAYGQIIAFSGAPADHPFRTTIHSDHLLGVLNHAYTTTGDELTLPLQFSMPDDTREAFILGNNGAGVSILASSGWLEDIVLTENTLTIKPGSAGILRLRFPKDLSKLSANVPYTAFGKHEITIQYHDTKNLIISF